MSVAQAASRGTGQFPRVVGMERDVDGLVAIVRSSAASASVTRSGATTGTRYGCARF